MKIVDRSQLQWILLAKDFSIHLDYRGRYNPYTSRTLLITYNG